MVENSIGIEFQTLLDFFGRSVAMETGLRRDSTHCTAPSWIQRSNASVRSLFVTARGLAGMLNSLEDSIHVLILRDNSLVISSAEMKFGAHSDAF